MSRNAGNSLYSYWTSAASSVSLSPTTSAGKPSTAPSLTQTTIVPVEPQPPVIIQQTFMQTNPKNYYYWQHTQEGDLRRFLKSSHERKDPRQYQVDKAEAKIAHGGQLTGWDEALFPQPCCRCQSLDEFRTQCWVALQRTAEEILATGRINRRAGPYPRS